MNKETQPVQPPPPKKRTRRHQEDDRHMICTSKDFCLCLGGENPWDECACLSAHKGLQSVCVGCLAPMIVVDLESVHSDQGTGAVC